MRLPLYRSAQVADYLRGQLRRGELTEPLPNMRAWSRQLGVSRPTLESALHQLQRDGLLVIHPRGVRIASRDEALPGSTATVRILHYGVEYPETSQQFEWIVPLSERLHRDGIQLTHEPCSTVRLQAIAEHTTTGRELFLLASLPTRYQKLFARHRKPAIAIGYPAEGPTLPFVTIDQEGAVRHAAQFLLRHGRSRLLLATARATAPGLARTAAAFDSICARWPRQPVYRRTVLIPLEAQQMELAARRLVAQATEPLGLVVVAPVPVSMLMTALLQRGVTVPGRVEMIAVLPSPDAILVSPRPAYYPFPVHRFVKVLGDAAVRFFGTGVLPPLRKTLAVEMVRAGG
jgi:hypothetical protein